jgi:FtsH-binding integral membrane protein
MGLHQSRLRWPEWVVGAGGVGLLASMLLLPWFQLSEASGPPGPAQLITYSVDGWNGLSHARWLLLVTILAAFALVLFQARLRAPAIPVTLSWVVAVLGGLSVLWLIYRVIISPAGGREIGGWIGLISAGAIAYGGFASLRLEGIARADAPQEIPTVKLRGAGRT